MAQQQRATGLAIIDRKVATLALQAGADNPVDLPRDFIYAGLILRLTGTLTITGGTTNGVVNDANPWNFLKKIFLEGTGGSMATAIKNFRGDHAARVSQLLTGVEPERIPVAAAAAAAYPFIAEVPIHFAQPGPMIAPEVGMRTVLNPAMFSKLNLVITAGAATDFVAGGDRALALSALSLDVIAQQAVNLSTAQARPAIYRETHFVRDTTAALATERRFANPLPTGNRYRYITLFTRDEATNKFQPVDDTLGAVKLFIGPSLVRSYGSALQIANRNRRENFVNDCRTVSGLNPLSSGSNPVVGAYPLDFMVGGRPDGLLDTRALPRVGVGVDILHDITTASARVLDVVTGEILG